MEKTSMTMNIVGRIVYFALGASIGFAAAIFFISI